MSDMSDISGMSFSRREARRTICVFVIVKASTRAASVTVIDVTSVAETLFDADVDRKLDVNSPQSWRLPFDDHRSTVRNVKPRARRVYSRGRNILS